MAERIADAPPWPEAERLAFEKESLGFFISGHPLERFRAEIAQWASATTATLGAAVAAANGEVTVGGIVTALRLIKTKKGDRMASFFLEDLEGSVETLVFPEAYKKAAGRLADDQVVLVKARAEVQDDGRAKLLASEVLPLEQAKLSDARFVTIRVPVLTWDRRKGIVLVAMMEETANQLAEWSNWLPEVAMSGKPPVGYGGTVFTLSQEWQMRTPGLYLGNDFKEAIENIERIIL